MLLPKRANRARKLLIRSPSVAMINVVSGTKLILAEKRAVPGEGIVLRFAGCFYRVVSCAKMEGNKIEKLC